MDANRNPYAPKSLVEDLQQLIAEESEIENKVKFSRALLNKAIESCDISYRHNTSKQLQLFNASIERDMEKLKEMWGEWTVRAKGMTIKGTLEDIHYIAELNTITRLRTERLKKRPVEK